MFGINKFTPFKKIETKSFEDKRKEVVKAAVEKAKKQAISEEDFNQFEKLLQKEDISDADYKQWSKLYSRVKLSTISCDNLNDFRYALEEVYSDPQYIKWLLDHENAHANKAQTLGIEPGGYRVLMIKKPDGTFDPFVDVEISIPDEEKGWTKAMQKDAALKITKAPDEYGNSMSELDKEKLEKIEEWYKE